MKVTKKKSLYTLAVLASFIAVIYSCSKDQAVEPEKPGNEEVTAENVSYSNFAGALFQTKCAGCHAAGGGASGRWTFSGFASVRDNGARINNVVLVTGTMPVGGSLSANEKALLKAWFDRNMPEQ
ncbi:MAG: hypothetical protein M5Z89_24625 [Olivibacter sp.]|jgi:hypothetical protein|uniref:hypothetical protein n=1 Tax=unclassified Olivibacter TaxID=2632301 RepID=UPI0011EB26B8|nr:MULTISPECIES: hypothetical protein [unclassified Olivibacter]MCL4642214.1 hypothetical protein [Olivibacter sp. UJ_SKK_5.1]MDM8173482.1 hypothetical protein [Olivibacter sp. 47]QEL03205.1 hypothetical protein FKG96_21050 [Olivibacter sp. LS-1]